MQLQKKYWNKKKASRGDKQKQTPHKTTQKTQPLSLGPPKKTQTNQKTPQKHYHNTNENLELQQK